MVARAAPLDDERDARAVLPVAGCERRQDLGVAHAGGARELLGDDRRLRVALCGRRHVLPLTAAAGREVAATGQHTRRPRLRHLDDPGADELRVALHGLRHDAVARRAVGHEDHLTVAVRERVEAERQPLDGQDVSQSRARRGRGASPRR